MVWSRVFGAEVWSGLAFTSALVVGSLLGVDAGWGQEAASSNVVPTGTVAGTGAGRVAGPPKPRLYDPAKIDVSLGIFPQLTPTRTVISSGQEAIQGTTPSGGLLTTFHQQFTAFRGYEVNFGFTRLVENYTSASTGTVTATGATAGEYTRGSIGTNAYELSGAYVAKGPGATKRLQTFFEGGPGMLIFQPTTKQFQGSSSVRAAALFGGGVDYRVSDHLGLRVEYRGLFYKNPDFAAVISAVPVSKQFTVTNEPTVSLTYRFGAYKRMQ